MKKLLCSLALVLTVHLLHAQTATLYATGFNQLTNVALDPSGNMYVANYGDGTIVKKDPSGGLLALFSGFNYPFGLAFDGAGNLYVGSEFGSVITKIDAGGSVSTFATGFSTPTGIAFDASGNLYVANYSGGTISKVDPTGTTVSTFATGIVNPISIVIDASGNLYVSSYSGGTVTKVDASGHIVATYTGFDRPNGLALDPSGNLYTTSYGSASIGFIPAGSPDGTGPTSFLSGMSFTPSSISYHDNALYATDGESSVYKITGGTLTRQTHHYVRLTASGANNGSTWADAYTNFQTAVDAALAGDSIFVAQATYQPASGTSFTMKEGVSIYGGFLGTEASFSQRNLANKATLMGNGTSVIRNENNSLTAAAMLDGFIVTGGGNNFASIAGGGMFNDGVSPTISNCIFQGNSTYDNGGAVCNYNASPAITNCIFSGNSNSSLGGAMYNSGSAPAIVNCLFSGNTTSGSGGAALFNAGSNPTIANCTFSGNYSDQAWGGGVYNDGGSAPLITNCLFSGNKANAGGGMYNVGSSPKILNCTFVGNSGGNYGDGILNYNAAFPVIKNTIIWGNGTTGMVSQSGASPVVSYSDVEGGILAGTGNISADPLFTAPSGSTAPFTDGVYTLQAASPAIDGGTPDTTGLNLGNSDLDDNPRIAGSAIDIGAYELANAPLPVTLISFTGALQNSMANFIWQTGVEEHLNHFELQTSTEGKTFSTVDIVYAKGGNSSYTASIAQTIPVAYYRLKMVDSDGAIKYSEVIRLSQNASSNSIAAFPNPAKNYINVIIDHAGKAGIYTVSGVLARKVLLQAGINKIDIRNLTAGTYFIVSANDHIKFIKE